MSPGTSSVEPAPMTGMGLRQLASSAARDLDGDVVIALRHEAGPAVVAASAGISGHAAVTVLPALEELESHGDPAEVIDLRRLAGGTAAVEPLRARGYVGVAGFDIKADDGPTAIIYVLRTVAGALANRDLLQAYANHAAVSLAAASRRQESPQLFQPPHQILEALDRLALSAAWAPDLISQLDQTLGVLFGPLSCGIALWDDQRRLLYFVPGSFSADDDLAVSCQVALLNPNSNAARVFATGDPYLSNHAAGDPAILQEYVAAYGLQRLIAVRLEAQGQPLGVLYVANTKRDFRVSDIWQLEALVPRISTAVECARAFFALRRRHQLERILSDVAIAIASGRSTADFLAPALEEMEEVIEASVIALVPTDSKPIVWRSSYAHPELERELLAGAMGHPSFTADVKATTGAGDPGSATLQVPVQFGSERVATLAVLRRRAEPFTSDERHALKRLAKLAGLARAMDDYQQERSELARISERQRIADDLHDEVSQLLFGAQVSLDSTLELRDLDQRATAKVSQARELLRKSDDVLREIIGNLSRATPTNLVEALEATVSEIEHEYDLPINLQISRPTRDSAISMHRPLVKTVLRATREALINASKHAGPCRAIVRLDIVLGRRLQLSVSDDGIGIDERDAGGRYGLTSLRRLIREQGGSIDLTSGATGGTTLVVTFRL